MNKKSKILSIMVIFVFVLFISGCGKTDDTENKTDDSGVTTVTCTKNATIAEGIESKFNCQYTYKDGYVQEVHTVEELTSDNENYLNTYKSLLEDAYEPYQAVKYYEYDIQLDGNTLKTEVKIDYANVNTDELIAIDTSNASLIKDGKVKEEDLRSLYETGGATCK